MTCQNLQQNYLREIQPVIEHLMKISIRRTDKHHIAGFFPRKENYCFKGGLRGEY